jgi:hypothetical protein
MCVFVIVYLLIPFFFLFCLLVIILVNFIYLYCIMDVIIMKEI